MGGCPIRLLQCFHYLPVQQRTRETPLPASPARVPDGAAHPPPEPSLADVWC